MGLVLCDESHNKDKDVEIDGSFGDKSMVPSGPRDRRFVREHEYGTYGDKSMCDMTYFPEPKKTFLYAFKIILYLFPENLSIVKYFYGNFL